MSFALVEEKVPLTLTPEGMYRIGKTRVPLDIVIDAFHDGYSPEEVVMQYDTLKLVEVYQVIGYYLNHKNEINEYMKQREIEAERIKQMIEKNIDTSEIRAKIIARKKTEEFCMAEKVHQQ